jgi:hypothetical protein
VQVLGKRRRHVSPLDHGVDLRVEIATLDAGLVADRVLEKPAAERGGGLGTVGSTSSASM